MGSAQQVANGIYCPDCGAAVAVFANGYEKQVSPTITITLQESGFVEIKNKKVHLTPAEQRVFALYLESYPRAPLNGYVYDMVEAHRHKTNADLSNYLNVLISKINRKFRIFLEINIDLYIRCHSWGANKKLMFEEIEDETP